MNIEGVPQILQHVLEGGDFDIKDVWLPGEDERSWWEQVGGDYGDPWTYGGEWYNPVTKEAVYFRGIEDEKEIEPGDVNVPERVMAKITGKIHDPYLDTPEAKEDAAWHTKQLRHEEWELDRIVGDYQYARAAFLNDRKQRTFYGFDVPEKMETWLTRHEEAVKKNVGAENDYDDWPVYAKMFAIGSYIGVENFAEPFVMNRIEAQKYFGTKGRSLRPSS
jgi:hypothetical protein